MIGRRHLLAGLAAGALPARARAGGSGGAGGLDGLWTNATYTDLQRPKEFTSLVLTAAEAEAFEAPRRALNGMPASKAGTVGQAESEFNERGDGLLRIRGEIRSSLITDPPDGKIPWNSGVARELGIGGEGDEDFDGPEARPTNERCMSSYGSGPPMLPGPDTNVYKFVQTDAALAIWCEKYHDVRTIRLDGGPPGPWPPPPRWNGWSRGRWAGEVLVVETAGFPRGVYQLGQGVYVSGATRVSERFQRTGAAEITYGFSVDDPVLYARPWSGELVFRPAPAIFEYACHEGNYGLPDILSTARYEEKTAAGK